MAWSTLNEFDFDALPEDAKKAAFTSMGGAGGGEKSQVATAASKKADASGKKEHHQAAAKSHKEAAAHHREQGNEFHAQAHESAARSHARSGKRTENQEYDMALTINQRKAIIAELTTNCDCWKHQGDAEVLNGMIDEKLLHLKEVAGKEQLAVAVANSAVRGFKDGNTAYRCNPETGNWERRTVNAGKGEVDDEEDYSAPPGDAGADEDEEDMALAAAEMKKKNLARMKGKTNNEQPRRARTTDELIRSMPEEVQNSIAIAREVEKREKDAIISQLLVNVAEADKRVHYDRLIHRSVAELRDDLLMIPKQSSEDEVRNVAGNKRRLARREESEDGDMLAMPTINWSEVEGGDRTEEDHRPSSMPSMTNNSDAEDWESFVKNAPPRFRSMVNNVTVIESREKRKLIEQLTANVVDEEAERRLINRLEGKSLEELQELLALNPRRETPKPVANYFGSSAPLANSRTVNDSSEDILTLPKMDFQRKEAQ